MSITERTLRRWRRDALGDSHIHMTLQSEKYNTVVLIDRCEELSNRILRMTQELLDQHLLQK